MSDLPEGTERVVVLYYQLSFTMDPEEVPEGVTQRSPVGFRSNTLVVIEEGEEVPLQLAERCWETFNERLAAYDGDGVRLDTPSAYEERNFSTAAFRHR